ncbi:MAG: hypothetical protein RLZZ535_682 [Cyanobacteriota bacterium]
MDDLLRSNRIKILMEFSQITILGGRAAGVVVNIGQMEPMHHLFTLDSEDGYDQNTLR